MHNVLDHLKQGILRFQTEVHAPKAEVYQYAATHPQKPHTLVISCSDSRIDLEAITSAGPGELFITRNIGNMVPTHGEMTSGVSAVVEYAVTALGVQHVVVCGHSDCGAMKALLNPSSTDALPEVRTWLGNGRRALQSAETAGGGATEDGLARLRRLTEENVLLQIEHLKTHPAVVRAKAESGLTVSGWVYEIGSGEVRVAADGSRTFQPVSAAGVDQA